MINYRAMFAGINVDTTVVKAPVAKLDKAAEFSLFRCSFSLQRCPESWVGGAVVLQLGSRLTFIFIYYI